MKIEKSHVEDILALTPMQEGILFHYLKNRNKSAYLVQMSYTFSAIILNMEYCKQAWEKLTETNEMLRTVYRWEQLEHPVQIILKNKQVPIHEHDLSHLEKNEQKIELDRVRVLYRETGLDIRTNPLMISICILNKHEFEIILTYNHIILDGWSTMNLIRAFIQNYQQLMGMSISETHYKSKYKEYLLWIQNQEADAQELFWNEYFTNFVGKTTLINVARKAEEVKGIRRFQFQFPEQTKCLLTEFCSHHKVTPASIFYTAWGILLQQYCNSDDVLFGIVVSGRPHDILGVEDMVGLFMNTLPLRVVSVTNETMIEAVKRVNRQLIQRENMNYTSLSNIKRKIGLTPMDELFDSLLIVENYPLHEEMVSGQDNIMKIVDHKAYENIHYPLTIEITVWKELIVNFMYNPELLNSETMKQFSSHFANIINSILSNPYNKRIDVEMLDEFEKHELVYTLNETSVNFEKGQTIHSQFMNSVERNPNKVAVVCNQKSYTFYKLNEMADCFAAYLTDFEGVRATDLVGIYMDKTCDMIVALLAVLKIGGTYVPISKDLPLQRITQIFEESKIAFIIYDQSPQLDLDSLKLRKISIDTIMKLKSNKLEAHTEGQLSDTNLAYVIFTSGSTGKPKGVMVTHRNVVNFFAGMDRCLKLEGDDVMLSVTNISFDISVLEIFWTLTRGITVILKPDGKEYLDNYDRYLSGVSPHKLAFNQPITIMQSTPSRLKMLLDDKNSRRFLGSLKVLLVGGEAFSLNLGKGLQNVTKARIFNLYGPTETTIWSTCYELPPNITELSVGKPIANTQIYLLNDNLKLVPKGVTGEIFIGGEGVAKGYLNNDKLTEERFIANIINYNPETRLYRTGDLGRYNSDGTIEVLGRKDDQIKFHGYRIELGEIETLLSTYSPITQVVVVPYSSESSNQSLIAYYLSAEKLDSNELIYYARSTLPEYMVPVAFIKLEEIPLTPNGKIDRQKLREIKPVIETKNHLAPRNVVEAQLVKYWEILLGIENIGVDDNIFDMGGNSSLLVQFYGKIDASYPGQISISDIFAYPSISRLAEYLNHKLERECGESERMSSVFPDSFYTKKDIPYEKTTFHTQLAGTRLKQIQQYHEHFGTPFFEIFISAFFYSLWEELDSNLLSTYTMLHKPNMLKHILIDMEQMNGDKILEFIQSVGLKHAAAKWINITDLSSPSKLYPVKNSDSKGPILTLIGNNKLATNGNNLLEIFGLMIDIQDYDEYIEVFLEFNSALLEKETIRTWFNRMLQITQFIYRSLN
ncbi:non-ribosomal peptide synthetase [Paenibacillus apiarius]|uniref:Non-ribosomal peptide synthetase n=1 Tax=Paenibacillus apiarius TaxID=46240 RepID=A0ABT4DQZ1_9BACL|nr:non-ribosomal peptide synthetase [Paenibacillus apiarius]MCY9517578.1 non-ribosomal peptide synthetase [Paenibacillus apiarius]MCY9519775.1 non-ribosomal peptide synthetase [Paenibacillus apiarius]MCY9555022.1 non-ribosomal peptide synthetase [Paenibacillus apiarius]MCY9559340.1 non-ribosomal peptide synthetase [Paenibacillus apiarius]MCY9682699.1 non-ribosomal peptide synthetase [Paenibacillus apiarius]